MEMGLATDDATMVQMKMEHAASRFRVLQGKHTSS